MSAHFPDETIEEIEDGIVTVLEEGDVPDSTVVEPFPGDPSTFRMTTQGALLVIHENETYDVVQEETVGVVSVDREPRFNVVCIAKNRRTAQRREGHGSVYALIEYALRTLTGADAAGYEAIPVDDQALGINQRDKTWRYQLTFRLET